MISITQEPHCKVSHGFKDVFLAKIAMLAFCELNQVTKEMFSAIAG
jgi:hypothetical protein